MGHNQSYKLLHDKGNQKKEEEEKKDSLQDGRKYLQIM